MDTQKIKERLFNSPNIQEIKGETIDLGIFDETIIKSVGVRFVNCNFTNLNVEFSNLNLEKGIAFYGCDFEGHLSFISCIFYGKISNDSENETLYSLGFTNCTVGSVFQLHSATFKVGLFLNNFTAFDSSIQNIESSNWGVVFNKLNIQQNFRVFRLNVIDAKLRIENSVVLSKLELDECTFQELIISSNHDLNELTLISVHVPFMDLSDNTFKGIVDFKACNISNILTLESNLFEDRFNVFPSSVKEESSFPNTIVVRENNFKNDFLIGGNSLIDTERWKLHRISIQFFPSSSGSIFIQNLKVNEVYISGVNKNSNLTLKSIHISRLHFIRFHNYGIVQIHELKNNDNSFNLVLEDSTLNNTNFTNCDFNKDNVRIQFQHSDITQIKSNNTSWFKPNNIIPIFKKNESNSSNLIFKLIKRIKFMFYNINKDEIEVKETNNKRDLFRQLKFALTNSGNITEMLIAKSYEQQEQLFFLRYTKRFWDKDRFVLWINSFNNFGTNWFKPLFLILPFVTFVFFISMIITSSNKFIFLPATSKNEFISTLNYLWYNKHIYFNLFNPIRKIQELFPNSETNSALIFLDLLHRVSLGVLFYQIITAFRKFGK